MHFEVDYTVQIGNKFVDTVHSVKTKYDSQHIGSTCDIELPLNCVLQYTDGKKDFLTAYALTTFKPGDKVIINAWYITEAGIVMSTVNLFTGYVFEFKLGFPITVHCIDYLPLLGNLQNITNYTGTMKNLINQVISGSGISLILPTLDLTLVKISFKDMSPWGILDYLKKNIGINISLSGTQLYCNVASNTLDVVKIDSRFNVHKRGLQQPDTVWQGYRVKAWFINNNGTRNSIEVGDATGHVTEVYYYKVQGGLAVYNQLAGEALNKLRQKKFSGNMGGYLYPVVKLFDRIDYSDYRYPEMNGSYVVTEIEHVLDDEGILVNMRWAYLVDFLNQVAA